MNHYRFLTQQKWSDNLGRKAPPLRSYLSFTAYYQWVNKKYNFRAKNLFITFSRLESGNINADTFVNAQEKQRLVDVLVKSIKRHPKKISQEFNDLKQVSLDLLRISKTLTSKKLPLKQSFNIFCRAWENFSPAYFSPIFFQAALEKIILAKYASQPEMFSKVLNFISSGFKSDSFNLNIKSSDNQHSFNKKELVFLKLLKQLATVRDMRQHCRDQAWIISKPFFNELGKQTRLGQDVIRAAPAQIIQAIEQPRAHKQFPRDCLVYNQNGVHIDYHRDLSKIKQLVWPQGKNSKLIKGTSAFGGVAIGKIRRIMYYDKKILLPGEILLTKMTTPQFVPLLKNCAGIITDAGGLTCHAAILAREFKKPCIIGTNHATSLLKTGNTVQLDAHAGIIKKLT